MFGISTVRTRTLNYPFEFYWAGGGNFLSNYPGQGGNGGSYASGSGARFISEVIVMTINCGTRKISYVINGVNYGDPGSVNSHFRLSTLFFSFFFFF